ncbi:MAG: hypothetical protein IPP52_15510 [Ignavibacteria bacterium]|nr:hypothetical protein [Ignavibacteria bacterium]
MWNVKRILRPEELGPFDYDNENYSKRTVGCRGLTSFL